MKKYLFLISHPAHFHLFKNLIARLKNEGAQVVVVVRPKDIVKELCNEAGIEYYCVKERPKSGNKLTLLRATLGRTMEINHIVRREKPDMLLGSDGVLAYVGRFNHIPSFEFFDDDYPIIKLYAWAYFPFYTDLVCPTITNAGPWSRKKHPYEGYQKLAYLHPRYFMPDKSVVEKYFPTDNPYFIIRLSQLQAHHDGGIRGISPEVAHRIIQILKPHGHIYITSERPLEADLEPYRLNINLLDIHHIMSFATLYIGDSQSMAVEAAILGTPSVRFNDFAGKISVLEELEHSYGLTFGIPTSKPQKLYDKLEELLATDNLKAIFEERRQKMLADKIDVNEYFHWLVTHYPESRTAQYPPKS